MEFLAGYCVLVCATDTAFQDPKTGLLVLGYRTGVLKRFLIKTLAVNKTKIYVSRK